MEGKEERKRKKIGGKREKRRNKAGEKLKMDFRIGKRKAKSFPV